jgi:hypothetical protein
VGKVPRWAYVLATLGIVLLVFGTIVSCMGVDVRAAIIE